MVALRMCVYSHGVTIDPKTRKTLAAAANRLSATATVAAGDVSDGVVAHVARTFNADGLAKVRISTDDRELCALTAEQLASRLDAGLVQLVGRVATLYRPPADQSSESPD